ncbi:hypothetical protein [Sinorhizobium meliloti]|uniref:hypothetical protein n=1 Tax=Rhizobium meliloti TaxID=382 RepID=UPI001F179551|nr:hypothetical protein [Sinorhizobium meliloti]
MLRTDLVVCALGIAPYGLEIQVSLGVRCDRVVVAELPALDVKDFDELFRRAPVRQLADVALVAGGRGTKGEAVGRRAVDRVREFLGRVGDDALVEGEVLAAQAGGVCEKLESRRLAGSGERVDSQRMALQERLEGDVLLVGRLELRLLAARGSGMLRCSAARSARSSGWGRSRDNKEIGLRGGGLRKAARDVLAESRGLLVLLAEGQLVVEEREELVILFARRFPEDLFQFLE